MQLEWKRGSAAVALFCLSPLLVAAPDLGDTERVSVDSSQGEANHFSDKPALSADGRFVAFESWASDLVPGDTNSTLDVFVHDRQAGTTTRVSVSSSGGQGNASSCKADISADGRYVVFLSDASNLVSGDGNGYEDVFLHDRNTGSTTRVNLGPAGEEANLWSTDCFITPDGSRVVFTSRASNLVANDTNGGWGDVFVRDLAAGTNTIASKSSAGQQGDDGNSWAPSISADGRTVAFESAATGLVPGDTNGSADVFVHELDTGLTTRVSVDSSGGQSNSYSTEATLAADGRFVAFRSFANNLVPGDVNGVGDVFLHDRESGETSFVSLSSGGELGDAISREPSISADGRRIAFLSWAGNLVPGDTNGRMDVFVRDALAGTTHRVSLSSAGAEANGHSSVPAITPDGRFVAFQSWASNLVGGDGNEQADVFVHDYTGEAGCPAPAIYCTPKSALVCGPPAIGYSGAPSAGATAGFVLFAGPARGNRSGVLLYGDAGPASFPFQGGILCIHPAPLRRSISVSSGGTSGACDGEFRLDMNRFASGAAGGNPAPTLTQPGQAIYTQWWGRDSVATGSFLSDALQYIVCD